MSWTKQYQVLFGFQNSGPSADDSGCSYPQRRWVQTGTTNLLNERGRGTLWGR